MAGVKAEQASQWQPEQAMLHHVPRACTTRTALRVKRRDCCNQDAATPRHAQQHRATTAQRHAPQSLPTTAQPRLPVATKQCQPPCMPHTSGMARNNPRQGCVVRGGSLATPRASVRIGASGHASHTHGTHHCYRYLRLRSAGPAEVPSLRHVPTRQTTYKTGESRQDPHTSGSVAQCAPLQS